MEYFQKSLKTMIKMVQPRFEKRLKQTKMDLHGYFCFTVSMLKPYLCAYLFFLTCIKSLVLPQTSSHSPWVSVLKQRAAAACRWQQRTVNEP